MNTNTPGAQNALSQSKAPSVAEEMAKFSGFTTNNGVTVKPDGTTKGPGDRNLTDEEAAAGMTIAGEQPRTKASGEPEPKQAKAVELTDDEKDAALEKARTVLKLTDEEELSDDEEKEALAAALADKKTKSGAGKGKRELSRTERRALGATRAAERRAREAEQTARSLEARLAALEGKGSTLTQQADTGKADDDKEPDFSKFELGELDPKYIRALARWEVRQEMAHSSKTQQTERQNSQREAAAAAIAEKRTAFEEAGYERFDDFQDVVLDTVNLPKTDPAAWPLSATIGALILESEFGPEVAYALASDPKEAKRVDKLSDAEKQRWFFRQEAKFEAEKTSADASGEQEDGETGRQSTPKQPAQRTATQAPPPPRRRNNGAGSNRGVTPATTDFAAFEAMARAGSSTRR